MASLVAPTVKNPPSMQEKQVQFLDQKDSLEKGMATHSSILAGEFHGQRSLVGYSPWGHKESGCLFFQSCGGQDPKNVSFKISSARLHSFWRLWAEICFLVIFGF